jgi:hypothetical protein
VSWEALSSHTPWAGVECEHTTRSSFIHSHPASTCGRQVRHALLQQHCAVHGAGAAAASRAPHFTEGSQRIPARQARRVSRWRAALLCCQKHNRDAAAVQEASGHPRLSRSQQLLAQLQLQLVSCSDMQQQTFRIYDIVVYTVHACWHDSRSESKHTHCVRVSTTTSAMRGPCSPALRLPVGLAVPLLPLLPLPAAALLLPAGPSADGGRPVMLSTVTCSDVEMAYAAAEHDAAAALRRHGKHICMATCYP